MKAFRISQAVIIVVALANGCSQPRVRHADGGPDSMEVMPSPDALPDRPSDVADVPDGGAGDTSPDSVVVAMPGTVEKGKACGKDTDCVSGFCRDDVCCAGKCEGTCSACSAAYTGLDSGECGPVVAGMDPRGVCHDDSSTSKCGQDGTCDGAGACRKQGPDRVCAPASCSTDGQFHAVSTCDGKGTCAEGMTMSCGQYACATTGCAKPCAADSDCPDGNYCSNGTCKIKKIAGESCDNKNQCGSGSCSPDKVCCDTACTGACMACTETLTGQKNGTCAPVQGGKDPKDDCATDDPKTCGHDGTCDGKGGCRSYDSSVVCGEASCAGSIFTGAGACDGKGTCSPAKPVDCQQSLCGLSGCKTTCTSSAQCATGSYCVTATQSCAIKKANGVSCQGGGECGSGACVDGVCCESACQGTCYACSSEKTGQASGRCLPISGGNDPDNECTSSDPTSCGQDGACDGKGQCRKWPSASACAPAMCAADNKYLAARACDGNGTCVAAIPEDCGGAACALSGCKKICASNSDCTGTNYCDLNTKLCSAQKALGAACGANAECVTQSCVDGVCCESACEGKCFSCLGQKTGQTNGRCQPVIAGTDPEAECDASDPNSCGQDGTCDGKGQCGKWSAATICGLSSCNANAYQPAASCNGSGTCVAPPVEQCGGSVCNATGCKKSCASDQDCVDSSYCDPGTNTCSARKGLGAACNTGDECVKLFCVDGVCCNNACNGTCNACVKDKTGLASSGTCGPITAGTDPDAECAASDSTSCGLDGACDGSGQCRKWATGTQCSTATCSADNQFTAARGCDGNGTCAPAVPENCGANACALSGCKKTCTPPSDSDCTTGNYCDSQTKLCTTQKALGVACAASKECLLGNCVDGVCCENSCQGKCYACSNMKTNQTNGRCQPVAAGHDPDQECAETPGGTCQEDGFCDGAGQCRKWGPTVQCGPAVCSGNKYQGIQTCSGNGTCQTPSIQDCGSVACDDSGCKMTCGNDSECFGNTYCDKATMKCTAKKGLGTACGGPGECAQPFCVEGVCCESVCTGKCYSCLNSKTIQSPSGKCAPIPAGNDPDNECDISDPSTCGQNGACDGAGQCQLWNDKTQCAPPVCDAATNMSTAARMCNGNGACSPQSPQSCAPRTCGGTTCKQTCTTSADCTSGTFCDLGTGMCAAPRGNGMACTGTEQCASGNCTDDVCCDFPCNGSCQACNLAGSKGTCTIVTGNPPPKHPACGGSPVACAGSCQGNLDGQCTYSTLSCGECSRCSQGACTPVKNQVNPGGCAGTCDASSVCKSKQGQACTTVSSGCVSGTTCSPEGICCDRSCTGSCEACDIAGLAGTCSPVASGAPHNQHPNCGTDMACYGTCSAGQCSFTTGPCGTCKVCSGGQCQGVTTQNDPACVGTCQTCSSGLCVTVTNGPDSDSCPSGTCNASGACQTPASLSFTGTAADGDFGDVVSPGRSFRSFEVKNVGTQQSMAITLAVSGQGFAVLSPRAVFHCASGQTVLAPGSSCFFDVAFSPSAKGDYLANLTASAIGSGTPAVFALKGKSSAQSQASAEYMAADARAQLGALTVGSDGRLWFIENFFGPGSRKIGAIATSGVSSEFDVGSAPVYGMALGSDGNMWALRGDKLSKVTTAGVVSSISVSGSAIVPTSGMVRGLDGNFWLREKASIVRLSISGAVTRFDTSQTGGGAYGGVALGPDGNIWYTDSDLGAGAVQNVAKITNSGVVTKFSTPGQTELLGAIIKGQDGNLWYFKDKKIGKVSTAGSIVEFGTPNVDSAINEIFSGPDNNVWVVTVLGHIFVFNTTGGFIKKIDLIVPVGGLALGPDGNAWFFEQGGIVGKYVP